jgi:hypothetical protein
MSEKRLIKPPKMTPAQAKAVARWLKYWRSMGGKVGAGTPERKERARHAANVRWGNTKKPAQEVTT